MTDNKGRVMRTIDLHCHTKATKRGDGKGRNVSPELFRQKLSDAGVQIVAITNHNLFDQSQFLELREAASDVADVWPGVELDVQSLSLEGKTPNHWHMIVILGPSDASTLANILDEMTTSSDGQRMSPNECMWPLDVVWSAFHNTNAIFISHCHDKKPAIEESDIESIKPLTGNDSWRFFYEPTSLITLGIWSNHGRSMLMGSDVKDWSKYEANDFVSLRLDVSSFEQFLLLARRDCSVIETLLDGRNPQVMRACPHPGVRISLPIYQDVNVIFGQKGTGKTEIVRSLEAEYKRLGVSTSTYYGGEKYQEYERLLSTDDMARDPAIFGRSDRKQEIEQVMNWRDQLPTFLHDYVDWYTTRGNNEKKDAFVISESQLLPIVQDVPMLKAKNDLNIVDGFIEASRKAGLKAYLSHEDSDTFQSILAKLSGAVRKSWTELFLDKLATDMANNSLRSIKNEIDKKSNTASMPDDTGFLRFALGRIHLSRIINAISEDLKPVERTEEQYLGTLEGKGTLNLVSRWRYLKKGSKTSEFGVGIRSIQQWTNALESVRSHVFKDGLPEAVAEFQETVVHTGVYDLSPFIGVKKYPVLGASKTQYKPSDGEKGIIVLERKLHEEASVYLLDEPELGMSNLYIDSVIRPLIESLSQTRKTVILATHNANLAVRTLPYLSVYREHVQGDQYRTYLGNPFRNELVDLDNVVNPLDWTECSMATLEGGSEAFYDRKAIYEAGVK